MEKTTAVVQDKNWGQVSDHRSVMFHMSIKLKLKDTSRRVAKSLFYCPDAVKSARNAYITGVDELPEGLEKVSKQDKTGAQEFFVRFKRFLNEPWKRLSESVHQKEPFGSTKGLVMHTNSVDKFPGNGMY